jgi:7-carboxy-7-deazaguanine synthase
MALQDNPSSSPEQPDMLISEIYQSRQGEGSLTGTESVFIRTSGCNLRCDFCDTPFTSWSPEGQKMLVSQIVDLVLHEHSADHVVITGGEPMLPKEMPDLCAALSQAGQHITIETAGTIYQELHCDLMSISPKLSNSTPPESRAGEWTRRHEATRFRPEIVRRLIDRHDYQLKFVIDQPADIDSIIDYLEHVQPIASEKVMLMPQGVELQTLAEKAKWIEPMCREHGFTYCPRRHIEWYGNKRGT